MIPSQTREMYHRCLQDETYFCSLFQHTYQVVGRAKKKYPLRNLDNEDIDQEARLVLFRLLQKFHDDEQWSNHEFERLFYAYYHTSLGHHFMNCWRYETAGKRNVYFQLPLLDEEQWVYPQAGVEEIALLRVEWKGRLSKASAEDCHLLKARLAGKSIRHCARELHRGTQYTSHLLRNLRKKFS